MTEEKHTPEPWGLRKIYDGYQITTDEGEYIEMSAYNARRVVACVNACAGIPLSVLEKPGYSVKSELDTLDDQIEKRLRVEQWLKNIMEIMGKVEVE